LGQESKVDNETALPPKAWTWQVRTADEYIPFGKTEYYPCESCGKVNNAYCRVAEFKPVLGN